MTIHLNSAQIKCGAFGAIGLCQCWFKARSSWLSNNNNGPITDNAGCETMKNNYWKAKHVNTQESCSKRQTYTCNKSSIMLYGMGGNHQKTHRFRNNPNYSRGNIYSITTSWVTAQHVLNY
eukprot:4459496-Amphidinium_carterae.1